LNLLLDLPRLPARRTLWIVHDAYKPLKSRSGTPKVVAHQDGRQCCAGPASRPQNQQQRYRRSQWAIRSAGFEALVGDFAGCGYPSDHDLVPGAHGPSSAVQFSRLCLGTRRNHIKSSSRSPLVGTSPHSIKQWRCSAIRMSALHASALIETPNLLVDQSTAGRRQLFYQIPASRFHASYEKPYCLPPPRAAVTAAYRRSVLVPIPPF